MGIATGRATKQKASRGAFGRKQQRGSISLVVMMVLAGMAMVVLAMASSTTTQMRAARAGQDAVVTQTLAEAGVDDAVDQLAVDRTITSVDGSLCADAACTKTLGSYHVDIADVAGEYGKKRVTSRATAANRATRTVVALLSQGDLKLGNAALMSNGSIAMGGNARIDTVPADQHVANVFANGTVSLGGAGFVDGRLVSASVVSGTAYYPSVSNAPPYPFPTAYEQTQMQNGWIARSQSAGSVRYTNPGNLFSSNSSTVTITAPAYLSGDLQLSSSQTLVLRGEGIIYLSGNLKITSSSRIINGSTLVVGGSFNQAGQSQYLIDTDVSLPTLPSLTVCTGNIGLQGGGGNYTLGAVYALRGSISVSGCSSFTGSLVAGGTNAQISATGTYNQYFPVERAAGIALPSKPVVTHLTEL